ncbi:FxSxx-COOH system tetratricopeptide repeat protein [Kitasatospora sp. NBC_01250]|uniref:FxSxx-COOH system tetratricopeptide repeat protein n=1 Tax=Kitasatospora sp. NBC_01250 TaxID=2903571 RepID=UPI002E363171|nr:FxSxx-COOH system tetratricopeptide repeat protein [Kitasatospora sp. NBC_01250]
MGARVEAYFFLSYARADDSPLIAAFYRDLGARLLARDPAAAGLPPFRDVEQIRLGADWERALADAVAGCRAMVALYSPGYFASSYCGKEWTAFHSRVVAFRAETGWDPRALVPVLWRPVAGALPGPVAELQYSEPAMGERYPRVGLRSLLAEEPPGPEYHQVLDVLTDRIALAAGRARLPGLPGLDLGSFVGAFPVAAPEPPPVHLSYAPAGRLWAEWAAAELAAAGRPAALHGLGTAGADQALQEALDGRGRVLALLSPDYPRHPAAAGLWSALAGHAWAPGRPTLLSVRVGESTDPLPAPFGDQVPGEQLAADATVAAAQLAALAGEPVAAGGAPVTARPARGPRPRFPGERPAVFDAPVPTSNFTGRDEVLESLRAGFLAPGGPAVQVLQGMGGVGKTQTAAEYARRYAAGYDVVWWIAAEQPEFIAPRLAQLAPRLGLTATDDSADTAAQVLEALRAGRPHPRWLLILDNAGDPAELRGRLPDPPPGGHLLITSRDAAWARRDRVLELGVLRRAESLQLLERLNPELPVAAAAKLAAALGDLPLAIVPAAAWLRETGMPVAEYLELLAATATELLERSWLPDGDYPHSAAASWLLSLAELRRVNPAAAELLELCVHFGPEPIPTRLLFAPLPGTPVTGPGLAGGPGPGAGGAAAGSTADGSAVDAWAGEGRAVDARLAVGELIKAIHRSGLARAGGGTETLTVHRLVQGVIREQVGPERREQLRGTVQRLLAGAERPAPGLVNGWPVYQELLPHLGPSGAAHSTDPAVRDWLIDSVRYLYQRGLSQEACDLAERILACWSERDAEPGTQSAVQVPQLRRQYANTLRVLGRYRECYAIDKEVFAQLTRELGDGHPHSLSAANSLGADLRCLGRFAEACELDRTTLRRAERELAPGDPQRLLCANNLAVALYAVGDRVASLGLHERTWRQRVRSAPADPTTLSSAICVAQSLREAGRPAQALRVAEEAARDCRDLLGERHPRTLLARDGLAATYYRLGRFAEAEKLAEPVHRSTEEVLGAGSHEALGAAALLAAVRHALGEHVRAVAVGERAYREGRARFGGRHPLTVLLAGNLAPQLRAAGRTEEAAVLAREAAERFEAAMGPDHCDLGALLVNRATDQAVGDPAQAVRTGTRALELLTATVGTAHHHALAAGSNLALDLAAVGERGPAEELAGRCADLARTALGEGHALTRAVVVRKRLDVQVELYLL